MKFLMARLWVFFHVVSKWNSVKYEVVILNFHTVFSSNDLNEKSFAFQNNQQYVFLQLFVFDFFNFSQVEIYKYTVPF